MICGICNKEIKPGESVMRNEGVYAHVFHAQLLQDIDGMIQETAQLQESLIVLAGNLQFDPAICPLRKYGHWLFSRWLTNSGYQREWKCPFCGEAESI